MAKLGHHIPEVKKLGALPIAVVNIQVPFHDLDPLKVVWHGNYAKYFEIARCAVLDVIGYDYPQMEASGYAWPIIDLRTRFIKFAQYKDCIQIYAVIVEWELRLGIQYFAVNKENQQVITKAKSIQVPVNMETKSLQIGFPEILEQKINDWIVNNS